MTQLFESTIDFVELFGLSLNFVDIFGLSIYFVALFRLSLNFADTFWAFGSSAWYESAHNSRRILKSWINLTHDSSGFPGIDSETTGDSSGFPRHWCRLTHDSKRPPIFRFKINSWLKRKQDSEVFMIRLWVIPTSGYNESILLGAYSCRPLHCASPMEISKCSWPFCRN